MTQPAEVSFEMHKDGRFTDDQLWYFAEGVNDKTNEELTDIQRAEIFDLLKDEAVWLVNDLEPYFKFEVMLGLVLWLRGHKVSTISPTF